jgi:hypothetical protein
MSPVGPPDPGGSAAPPPAAQPEQFAQLLAQQLQHMTHQSHLLSLLLQQQQASTAAGPSVMISPERIKGGPAQLSSAMAWFQRERGKAAHLSIPLQFQRFINWAATVDPSSKNALAAIVRTEYQAQRVTDLDSLAAVIAKVSGSQRCPADQAVLAIAQGAREPMTGYIARYLDLCESAGLNPDTPRYVEAWMAGLCSPTIRLFGWHRLEQLQLQASSDQPPRFLELITAVQKICCQIASKGADQESTDSAPGPHRQHLSRSPLSGNPFLRLGPPEHASTDWLPRTERQRRQRALELLEPAGDDVHRLAQQLSRLALSTSS